MDTRDSENKDFVGQFEINGVPTVYVFVGQQPGVLYEGNREAGDIAKFVKKLQNLKVELLTSESDVVTFKVEHLLSIIIMSSE